MLDPQSPNYPFPHSSPWQTISSFSKSMRTLTVFCIILGVKERIWKGLRSKVKEGLRFVKWQTLCWCFACIILLKYSKKSGSEILPCKFYRWNSEIKWFKAVTINSRLWNLMICLTYLTLKIQLWQVDTIAGEIARNQTAVWYISDFSFITFCFTGEVQLCLIQTFSWKWNCREYFDSYFGC